MLVDDWKKVLKELHFSRLVVNNLAEHTDFENAKIYYILILVFGLILSSLFILPFIFHSEIENKLFNGYLIYFFFFIVALSFYLIFDAFFISKKHRFCFSIALVTYLFLRLAVFLMPDLLNQKMLYDLFNCAPIFLFAWLFVIVFIALSKIFFKNMYDFSLKISALMYLFVFFIVTMFFIISLSFKDGINLDAYKVLIVLGVSIFSSLYASLVLLFLVFFYIFSKRSLSVLVSKKIKLLFKNYDSNEFLKNKNDDFLLKRLQTYYIVSFLRNKNALKIEAIDFLRTRHKLYLSSLGFRLYEFMPIGFAVFFLINHLDSFMLEHIFNKEYLFNEDFLKFFASSAYPVFVVVAIIALLVLFSFGFLTPSKSVLDDILLELTKGENSKFDDLGVDEKKSVFFGEMKKILLCYKT